jgi:hypothetical protein
MLSYIFVYLAVWITYLFKCAYVAAKSCIQIFRAKCARTLHYNRAPFMQQRKLTVMTYNVQRLPFFMQAPNVDIKKLLALCDIVCLQEDFYRPGRRRQTLPGVGVFHGGIASSTLLHPFKVLDSGLSVYSKLKWESAEFVPYYDCSIASGDAFADKGYVVLEFPSFYLLSTHMQSEDFYTHNRQLQQMLAHIQELAKPVFLVGDFNIDLRTVYVADFVVHTSPEPTFPCKQGVLPTEWLDGALARDVHVEAVQRSAPDAYADHYALTFEIVV